MSKYMNKRKRLREYRISSFENFKVNEFIDYMMVATENEKKMWIEIWAKHYVWQERWWEWIKEGECIRLCSRVTCGGENRVCESFCVSRYSSAKEDIPRMIVENPWLKTEQDLQTYSGANSTFWYLIFIRLTTIDDVLSFSRVSQTHYRVARKDEAYRPWVEAILRKRNFYCNPFEGQPLWSQFLKLSGRPKDSWLEWVKSCPKCFFYLIVSMGRYGIEHYSNHCIYDEETWTIWKPNGGGKYIWRESEYTGKFHMRDFTGDKVIALTVPNTLMKWATEFIMRTRKH